MLMIYLFIFIFGLCIGSFLNVVIWRVYKGEKLGGRSRCPDCGRQLKWQENIPLLSFLFLRGRCATCGKSISWQYPLVELMTAVLFVIAFKEVFKSVLMFSCFNVFMIFFYWIVISFLIIIFVQDLKYYLILDKITLPATAIVFIFQVALSILNNHSLRSLVSNFLFLVFSGIIISSFFYLQYVISRGKWIGGGDIRLGFLMGLILGWPMSLVALFLAYILGSLVAIPLLLLGKKKFDSKVPFGVFLTSATLIILFWGEQILRWYLSLF